ncbi:MAG: hypothetical protein AAGH89_11870 [Verrucomicrobiota bacterium]
MNRRFHHVKDRWRRTPKGIRWLIIAATSITTLYVVEDLSGRIAWKNYHQAWEERGVTISLPDPSQINIPQDEDFWESDVMRKWEAMSPNYDPSLPNLLSGSYRTTDYVLKAASLEAATLTEFNLPLGKELEDFLRQAHHEDLALDGLFQTFADGCKRTRARSFGDRVPSPGRINDAAKHTCDRVAIHLHNHDPERACRDLIAFMQFSNHLREQALVGLLVNIAVCGILSDSIWEGLAMQAYDAEQLTELQNALNEVRLARDFAQPAFQEMGGIRDIIDDQGFRELLMSGTLSPLSRSTSDPFRHLQDLILRALDITAPKGRHFNAVIDSFSMWESVTLENGKVPDELTIEQSKRLNTWKPGWRSRISFMRAAVPNLGKIGESTLEAQQIFDFARISCALERYHISNKSYPDSLMTLVPVYLSGLPQDRFQPTLPIRYAKTPNGRYQLHGSGIDQKDDGGIPGRDLVWRYP